LTEEDGVLREVTGVTAFATGSSDGSPLRCVRRADPDISKQVYCWGQNTHGEAGAGANASEILWTAVPSALSAVHCTDGIMNHDETGVDCGGVLCDPCPSCTDGLLNGDEQEVDCGGSCPNSCRFCTGSELFCDDFESGLAQYGAPSDGAFTFPTSLDGQTFPGAVMASDTRKSKVLSNTFTGSGERTLSFSWWADDDLKATSRGTKITVKYLCDGRERAKIELKGEAGDIIDDEQWRPASVTAPSCGGSIRLEVELKSDPGGSGAHVAIDNLVVQ
jgi:hypothetical protein